MSLSQTQSKGAKFEASTRNFVENLANIHDEMKTQAFHTIKNPFPHYSKESFDSSRKKFEELQIARTYAAAALQKLSLRAIYENKRIAFQKWIRCSRAKAVSRVAIDSLFKALNSNTLRRKKIGFDRMKKACKENHLHACQLIWMILLKYTSINLQYGFQNLKSNLSSNSSLSDSSFCMQTPPSSERNLARREFRAQLSQESKRIPRFSGSLWTYHQNTSNHDATYHSITLAEAKIENLFETINDLQNRRKIEGLYAIMNYAYERFLNCYKKKFELDYYQRYDFRN